MTTAPLLPTSNHSLYMAWCNLKRRCNNMTGKDAAWYSARGISYTPRWETFIGFLADMGLSYRPGLSIDRIDNDGPYSADNCRWTTPRVQANNRSTNRKFTINGVTRNLAEWCETVNVKSSTVRQRLYVYKWPIEEALGLNKKGNR